ncbi:MAG: anti-sigma factor [Burkholderiales bacterium]|jgi:anti-sigma factor RsiW|nr:anti-sigma factor [Burkholderiales bacterium]
MSGTASETDLHAYVDGALDEAHRREVEAHLAANPVDAERVRAWQDQKARMRALFNPVLEETVPDRLRAVAAPRRRIPYALAAGALVAGIAIGWAAKTYLATDPKAVPTASLPKRAAVAHVVYSPEVRHPVEVGADQQEHLVNWLSKRVGQPLKAPILATVGFELVGGRLLPGDAGPVAQFMYQDARGQRLTLYVSRSTANRDTAFRFSQEDRVSVFYWVDGKLGYALSSELPKDRLLAVATAVYQQLNP